MFRRSAQPFLVSILIVIFSVIFSASSFANAQDRSGDGKRMPEAVHLALSEPLPAGPAIDLHEGIRSQGVVTFTHETFEGAFPTGLWQVFDNDGDTNGEYFWGADDFMSWTGTNSAWAARSGADGFDPESGPYPNDANSWMVFGPVDLTDALSAEVLFNYNNLSEENSDYFIWAASTDGSQFHGFQVSGDSGGWIPETFDLTNVPTFGNLAGTSSVWIAFIFQSDFSEIDRGPFVDDIVFQALIGDPAPVVTGILRAGPNPTRAASVDFNISFSEEVTGVDAGDFSLSASGVAGATVSGVVGNGATYTVTVHTGTGEGTVRLDLVDDDSIVDSIAQPLGGAGAGNGDYNGGESYTMDYTAPSVNGIVRSGQSPTGADQVKFYVYFDETVTGVDAADFDLASGGISGASVAYVFGAGANYTVIVDTGSGDGTLGLDLLDDDSILDLAGNPLGGDGTGNGDFTEGESFTIDRSIPTWSGNGPFGGYLNCLAKSPSNPDVMYAGANTGMFRSETNGAVWHRTNFPRIVVRSCRVSPADANVIFVGTDDGVFKSTDGGVSWTALGPSGARVNVIAAHPTSPDIILVGLGERNQSFEGEITGIYKSLNGGTTWEAKASDNLDAVFDILFDTDNPAFVYAACFTESAAPGFFKSIDGGNTWESRQIGPYNYDHVAALAMTPAGSAPRVIYAVSETMEDVYRSEDRGETWTPTNIPGIAFNEPWAIAVDPNAPDVVYVGGDVYRSVNGGTTWELKDAGLPTRSAAGIIIDPRDSRLFIAFESGGVYTSSDGAENWQQSNTGLLNTDITALGIDPGSSDRVYAAIGGYGQVLELTTNGGGSWSRLEDSWYNLGAIAIDPQNPAVLYVGREYDHIGIAYLNKSTDYGQTWNQTGRLFYVVGVGGVDAGISDIIVSPVNSDLVIAAVEGIGIEGGGIYKSTNGGVSWSVKKEYWIATLAIDPQSATTYYAGGARYGYVFQSTNGGDTWSNIGPGGNYIAWEVRDIQVDAGGNVYAATSDGLWRWDGVNWTQLSGLPTDDLNAVVIDRSSVPNAIYIGTESNGIFTSGDGGVNWEELNAGLETLSVRSLALGTGSPSVLYAGIRNGGVWRLELDEAGGPTYDIFVPLVVKDED